MVRPDIRCGLGGAGISERAFSSAAAGQLRLAARSTRWPSKLKMAEVGLSNRRVVQSRMDSNTGVTSVGDSLMTRSTSLMAVW